MKKKLLITLLSILTLVSTCLVGMESKEENDKQEKVKEIFEKMPDDCTGEIISFLEQRDVFKGLAFVSKKLYEACWEKYRNPITVYVSAKNMPSIIGGISLPGLLDKKISNPLTIKFHESTSTKEFISVLEKVNPEKQKIAGLDLASCYRIDWTDGKLAKEIAKLTNLKFLNLSWTNITKDSLITILSSCKNIEILNLYFCMGIDWTDGKLLEEIAELKNLKSLNLSSTKTTKESLITIVSGCKNIEFLNLDSCKQIDWTYGKLAKVIVQLPNLKSLDLSCTNIKNKSLLTILSSCKKIKHLNLYGCFMIDWTNGKLAKVIVKLPNLKSLNLSRTKITKESLITILSSCKKIEILNLYYCDKIDWSAGKLASLIAKLKNLEFLNLSRTRITSNSLLTIFSGCKKIELLDLALCSKISKEDVNKLTKSYPNCKIDY